MEYCSVNQIVTSILRQMVVLVAEVGDHWTAKIGGGSLDGRLGKYSISFILSLFMIEKSFIELINVLKISFENIH